MLLEFIHQSVLILFVNAVFVYKIINFIDKISIIQIDYTIPKQI